MIIGFWMLYFILPFILCQEDFTYSPDDFKCSLPDVTTQDKNLDIKRFRSDFSKISEVKFPGLIGPLNERLICKIKCIDGNWVGPLCSSTPDGRFQPILRECLYRQVQPLLAISFKNSSIEKETNFPHASVVTARCKHFGLYKIKGENTIRCENGEWTPKWPECVPTSVITNFTGDAPPTITYTVVSGSAVVEPSGDLYVHVDTTLRLDCMTLKSLGTPEWTWTQGMDQHIAAWSTDEGEKDTHFRLTLSKMSARHSDTYTCTSPGGHTNTVVIKVFAQGTKLGHSAHFSCQPGYHISGSALLTCMGNGRWSGEPPTCVETSCPTLKSLGQHLNVVEYNSSFGGRAVFQCAWGYRLVGVPGLECEHDGKWSGEVPVCIPIYCPDPLVSEHGRLLTEPSSKHGKYTVGDLMIYACEEGYQMVGESSIVCTENGFWSHPPPFCLPPSEIRKTDTIYVENATLVYFDE
ncbi:hypothetical protein O3G_MSEX012764 [Manduca sexta]|uniref:Locomotion-related protein Hikaru genki n=1 Tax=Manduca sexta TaxID=7130 RepID=A0A921ZPF9_MANSE|nr:hypothetical protein O3G_MSEX012764 [Manduca sexta]